MEGSLSDSLRRNLGKLIEQHPPIFVKPCLRRTSKGSEVVARLVYLSSDGLLLMLTSDGKKGKRIESLLDPNVLHSVFYAPKSTTVGSSSASPAREANKQELDPSTFSSRVVLWFQQSKDLALEFKNPATATHFVSLIEDLLATQRHPTSIAESGSGFRKAADVIVPVEAVSGSGDPFSRAMNMLESFPGHGAPSKPPPTTSTYNGNPRSRTGIREEEEEEENAVGEDDLSHSLLLEPASQRPAHSRSTEQRSPTGRRVSLTTIMASDDVTKQAEEKRRDEALQLQVKSVAEEYLLTLEVEQLNEDIAWMTDAKERRLRGEGPDSLPHLPLPSYSLGLYRRRVTEQALDELHVLVERICRRTQQLAAQRRERAAEEQFLRMLRRRQLREHPERDGTERFGEHLYVPSATNKHHLGHTPGRQRLLSTPPRLRRHPSEVSPLQFSSPPVTSLQAIAHFEDPLGLFPPTAIRPAVLPGSNGRLTSLGRPLERRYSDDVTSML